MREVIILILFRILFWGPSSIDGATDESDATALRGMYGSLNSPSQLTNWKSSGGDPCGDSWKGITCSGSKVTEIKLSGLGLTGSLGYQLNSLTSVTNFDISNNKFGNQIPYQLPPNVQKLNLAGCGFNGVIPYSVSQMTSLKYLNVSHNQLQGSLNDMFQSLKSLSTMDLSGNAMSGELPKSLSSLSNMTNMYLQDNQFKGPIDVLANLPLENLNVENNQFSGWIPEQLQGIKLQKDGNSWSSSPAPPPPPGTPPASTRPKRDRTTSSSDGDNNISTPPPSDPDSKVQKSPPDDGGGSSSSAGGSKSDIGAAGATVAGIVISILVVAAAVLALLIMKKRKSKKSSSYTSTNDLEKLNEDPFSPLASQKLQGNNKTFESVGSINPRPPPPLIDSHKSFAKVDNLPKESVVTKQKVDVGGPTNFTRYSLEDLKMATDNFSVGNIVGEGPIGCVYRGRCDGKVVAVKEIDKSCLRNQKDFDGIVTGISQLRHPNITELVGYCSERGQHLLVYEYHKKGSLHDLLHENSEALDLESRLKIALGTAQALAYLHEVCSPSVAHKNIKSANILLDMDLTPHLSDCGLACLHPSGDEARNAMGYTAPEVLKQEDEYTIMSDVYSFGVIMLELLSGRRAFDRSRPKSEQYLIRWAKPQLHDIDALENMADPALGHDYSAKSLSRFADVIASCVQWEPEFRPPISEVVETLVRLIQRANVSKRLRQNE